MPTRILNFVLQQAGWFACVLGGAHGRPWLGSALALALAGAHLGLVRAPRSEARLLAAVALVGAALETAQIQAGLLAYSSPVPLAGLPPVWVVVLWINFATLLRFCLDWLSGRYLLAALLGAAGGPLAFLAGERLGGVALDPRRWPSLVGLAVVWGVAMPVLMMLARRSGGAGPYRIFARPGTVPSPDPGRAGS